MFNLRFKYIVTKNIFYALLYVVPKANWMSFGKKKYSLEERFKFAKEVINHMRKSGRTTTDIYGLENIPKEGNYILYANHQGKYDALGILLALDTPCSVLWDSKQAKRIFSRQICRLIDGVSINLKDIQDKVKAIAKVTENVRKGKNMLIFPEGGYTDNHNNLQEFFSGCFHCSLRTGTTMVPVVLYDSYKAMNSNTLEKVNTQVHFLPSVPYEEYKKMSKPEIAAMVKGKIAEKLDEIKEYMGTQGGLPYEPDMSFQ